jgi:hypothetical protein
MVALASAVFITESGTRTLLAICSDRPSSARVQCCSRDTRGHAPGRCRDSGRRTTSSWHGRCDRDIGFDISRNARLVRSASDRNQRWSARIEKECICGCIRDVASALQWTVPDARSDSEERTVLWRRASRCTRPRRTAYRGSTASELRSGLLRGSIGGSGWGKILSPSIDACSPRPCTAWWDQVRSRDSQSFEFETRPSRGLHTYGHEWHDSCSSPSFGTDGRNRRLSIFGRAFSLSAFPNTSRSVQHGCSC